GVDMLTVDVGDRLAPGVRGGREGSLGGMGMLTADVGDRVAPGVRGKEAGFLRWGGHADCRCRGQAGSRSEGGRQGSLGGMGMLTVDVGDRLAPGVRGWEAGFLRWGGH
ncbi:hypothetical protein NDU88_011679, partial [Pleurodeles waltl]